MDRVGMQAPGGWNHDRRETDRARSPLGLAVAARRHGSGGCALWPAIGRRAARTTPPSRPSPTRAATSTSPASSAAPPSSAARRYSAQGLSDLFVAKYSPDGALVYVRTAGGPSVDRGHGARGRRGAERLPHRLLHDLGGVPEPAVERRRVGRISRSPATRDTPDRHEWFIARLQPNGDWSWARQIGGPGQDEGYGIAIAPGVEDPNNPIADGVIAVGRTSCPHLYEGDGDISPIGAGVTCGKSSGVAVRLDTAGNWVWAPRGRAGQRQRMADRRRGRRQRPGLRLGPLPGGDEHRHRVRRPPCRSPASPPAGRSSSGRSATSRAPATCWDSGVLEYTQRRGELVRHPLRRGRQRSVDLGRQSGALHRQRLQRHHRAAAAIRWADARPGAIRTAAISRRPSISPTSPARACASAGASAPTPASAHTGWKVDDVQIRRRLLERPVLGRHRVGPRQVVGLVADAVVDPVGDLHRRPARGRELVVPARSAAGLRPPAADARTRWRCRRASPRTSSPRSAAPRSTRRSGSGRRRWARGSRSAGSPSTTPASSSSPAPRRTPRRPSAASRSPPTAPSSPACRTTAAASPGTGCAARPAARARRWRSPPTATPICSASTRRTRTTFDPVQTLPEDDASTTGPVDPADRSGGARDLFVARIAAAGSKWRWVQTAHPAGGTETAAGGRRGHQQPALRRRRLQRHHDLRLEAILDPGRQRRLHRQSRARATGEWFEVDFQHWTVGTEVVPPPGAACLTDPVGGDARHRRRRRRSRRCQTTSTGVRRAPTPPAGQSRASLRRAAGRRGDQVEGDLHAHRPGADRPDRARATGRATPTPASSSTAATRRRRCRSSRPAPASSRTSPALRSTSSRPAATSPSRARSRSRSPSAAPTPPSPSAASSSRASRPPCRATASCSTPAPRRRATSDPPADHPDRPDAALRHRHLDRRGAGLHRRRAPARSARRSSSRRTRSTAARTASSSSTAPTSTATAPTAPTTAPPGSDRSCR